MKNKEKLQYSVFLTRFGWVGVLGSEHGLRRSTLPQTFSEEALHQLGPDVAEAAPGEAFLGDLSQRLRDYFAGERVIFPDALDLPAAPHFFYDVWTVARSIPYGERRTYKWLAEQAGRPHAFRAAGQAMARNPLPIIVPCHRVIASDGSLCGFGGGLPLKLQLIELEARHA
jgi:methylated-DNA-[protein]-cysteine S-methyltransferase